MAHSGNLVDLARRRQWARDLLARRYADDILDLDTYEERVEALERATAQGEIDALTADLLTPEDEALLRGSDPARPAGPPTHALAIADENITAIFSSRKRRGRWVAPRRINIRALAASILLDFRETSLPEGPVTLDISAFLAEVTLIVPPTVEVSCDATMVAAEFDDETTAGRSATPDIRITGRAALAEINVKERLPGESGWSAFWRRRRERKRQRKLAERKLRALRGPPDSP